jgi:glycosyltransferase involved in cell wall biosynthesis
LRQLPARDWLFKVHEPILDRELPLRLWWQQFRLERLAHECCDILFAPGGNNRGSFKPLVTMSQNLLPFESEEMKRYRWSWQFFRLLLLRHSQRATFRKSEGMVFLTEYARSAVMKDLGSLRAPSAVIPHGINHRFHFPPRPQREISSYSQREPFRFLYVSTVDQYKHQWNVAEAVAELRRTGWPVTLDLVGPAYGPALRRLQAVLSRLDPHGSHLRYHGAVPFSQLHVFYQCADVFIFASSCETIASILLEAMASGLPIACSSRGPMSEVLQNAGLYFNPEDPQELTQSLRTLILSPDLRQRSAARACALSLQYTWERCARDTFAFIAQVARNGAVRSPNG